MAVLKKLLIRPRTLILRTRKNKNVSSYTKLYCNGFSANKDKSKQIIVNKPLSQNYSTEVEKMCSTEIDKLEYTHVPNFNVSNVFECGRKNPDVSYERAYKSTEGNEYFTDILDTLNNPVRHH